MPPHSSWSRGGHTNVLIDNQYDIICLYESSTNAVRTYFQGCSRERSLPDEEAEAPQPVSRGIHKKSLSLWSAVGTTPRGEARAESQRKGCGSCMGRNGPEGPRVSASRSYYFNHTPKHTPDGSHGSLVPLMETGQKARILQHSTNCLCEPRFHSPDLQCTRAA